MKFAFQIYVIQIGSNQEVLYVNYSLDIDKSFQKFLHKHPQLNTSKLRPDLYAHLSTYPSSSKAKRAALSQIISLENKGFEVIAGGPLMNTYWQTYVIEIDGDPTHVYVGETNYPRQKRFSQHIYKFNPARVLLKHDILRLMDELCDDCKYLNKELSLLAEAQKASQLRAKGYQVEGGT